MSTDEASEESICGETFDHDQRVTYEDADTREWECRECGAEWWEDLG